MQHSVRSWLSLLLLVVLALGALVAPGDAVAQSQGGEPVTQADLARLEAKLEAQRQLVQRLIALQQQYVKAVSALTDDDGAASEPPPPPGAAAPSRSARASAGAGAGSRGKRVGEIVGRVSGAGSNAYVYVETVSSSSAGKAASMKQVNKRFSPNVLVVQRGSRVEFPNTDPVFHNVFSVTPEASFDLGSYPKGQSKGVRMSKVGVVSVYCNMHPQMVGYVLVVPSSHYVRVGKDGAFRLQGVPVGRHRLVAWMPNAKPSKVDVEVVEEDVASAELALTAGALTPHTNKDGLPYGSYRD